MTTRRQIGQKDKKVLSAKEQPTRTTFQPAVQASDSKARPNNRPKATDSKPETMRAQEEARASPKKRTRMISRCQKAQKDRKEPSSIETQATLNNQPVKPSSPPKARVDRQKPRTTGPKRVQIAVMRANTSLLKTRTVDQNAQTRREN